MIDFSNSQGTKIYFTISEEVDKAFNALLKYNNQNKLDLFVNQWMGEYDNRADYSVPNSEKTTISLDISDCDDSARGEILAWGRWIMKQEGFFEFMARKYCIETLKKLNGIFGVIENNKTGAVNTTGDVFRYWTQEEKEFAIFCMGQKRKIISLDATRGYISTVRTIKTKFGIDLYSITDISVAQELVRKFMPYGQYSTFNSERAGAPRAVTNAYVEYLEYKQKH